jgi:hypothetical protein
MIQEAFRRGDLCLGALDGGTLLGYVWFDYQTRAARGRRLGESAAPRRLPVQELRQALGRRLAHIAATLALAAGCASLPVPQDSLEARCVPLPPPQEDTF